MIVNVFLFKFQMKKNSCELEAYLLNEKIK